MTKKQIAALQRIIDREAFHIKLAKQNRKEGDLAVERAAGVHRSHSQYIVTDMHVAVLYPERPEGLPAGDWNDRLLDAMENDIDGYDHFLALTVTPAYISEWKKQAKAWKAGKTYKTGAVPVKIAAQRPDGGTVEGYYNPWYLVDVVEAIGPGAMVYIGKHSDDSPFCSLLVYPKDWMENSERSIGYVLPLRIM